MYTRYQAGPEPGNLIFTPAHHLLVIAIRRGLPNDVHTIDELLAFPGNLISIDVAHLNVSSSTAASQKATLSIEQALMAGAFSDYLQRRDIKMLERHYLNLTETLDQMGVQLEQPFASDENCLKWAPLALNKLNDANSQRTRGQGLTQMTRRLIRADPNPPKDTSPRSLKNYRRNARRIAEQQLFSLEAEKQSTTFSRADMDARLAGLRASNFADEVLRRAVEVVEADGIGNGGSGRLENEAADAEDPEGRLFVGGDQTGEDDSPAEPEEDLERAVARLGNDLPRDRDGAIIAALEDDNREMDVEDATSDPVKEHNLKAHLDSHRGGNFHHPVSRWKRKAMLECKRDGYLFCPYCEGAKLEGVKRYKEINELIRHIMGSGQLTTNAEHDKLKAADGWYDEDFAQADFLPASAESMVKYMRRGVKSLQAEDIEVSTPRQLLHPEPYEHSDRIVRGSHPEALLGTRYTPFVTAHPEGLQTDQPSVEDSIPLHLKNFVGAGYGLTPTNPLPAYTHATKPGAPARR
ncbi:hypothetical protein LTR12_005261 [Friedmanniomyces endolithicus]|nr:hypothetical protein LTR12_005261 [Friedmanniomyces endolithicus]